jgi:hypothetical protein
MHILILGARAPACLEWARAFHSTGWHITVADSLRWPVTRFSNTVHEYLRLPEPRSSPALWLDALRAAVEMRSIDLVLPTCEESFYLAYGRARIPCKVMTPDFDLMHRLHHKGRFAEMIRGWEVEAPETHLLATPEDLNAFTHPVDWVFKPAYSRFANRALLRPGTAQLNSICPTLEQPWIAQRFVFGREHCSFSLLTGGRLTAHACYHPRYRVGRGAGIWFEPTDPAPIRSFIERFGAVTGYTGQVAFDFVEQEDGCCLALECNPRATSGVHLFDDQHEALVSALLGGQGVLTPTPAPRQVALAMPLFAARRHGLQSHFWRDFIAARDVITRPGDHGPLLAQIPGLLEIAGRAIRRRCDLLTASTTDCEWNGQPMDALP